MQANIEYTTGTAQERALGQARGDYQRALLYGYESLSGASLRGKARKWSARYAESRANLLDRLRRAGLKVGERRGYHNKRILVIGE